MERHMLLSTLSKKGTLPEDFATKIDPHRRPCRIEPDTKERPDPPTVGESVANCIRNMTCASPAERWGCERVRNRLDNLMKLLDEHV